MKNTIKYIIAILFLVSTGIAAFAQGKKSVAIFVRNDSTKYAELLDANKKNLENILASYLNNSGFGVISQDLVLRNLNAYLGNDKTKYKDEAKRLKDSITSNRQPDIALFENASGLRLAEMIGADYIMAVSISNAGQTTKKSSLYGVQTENQIYTLRCNYSLCEAGMGVGTSGKSVKSEKMLRTTSDMSVENAEDLFSELLEDCASQMYEAMVADLDNKKIIEKVDASVDVIFEVKVTAARFPQVFQDADGSYSFEESIVPLELMTINADIDGVSYTTNTGTIKLSKGIHYLKITHKDLLPIEKTINVTGKQGQKFVYEGILTEEAKIRIKADMEWMQSLLEKHKKIAHQDKLREIDIERQRTLARGEAANVDINVKKAEVEISRMQAEIDIEKSKAKAEINRVNIQSQIESKMADAEINRINSDIRNNEKMTDANARTMDAENSINKKMVEAYAERSAAEGRAAIINANANLAEAKGFEAAGRAEENMSEAELIKAKSIYETLKQYGYKIKASINIE
ncbi:hypothetical protein [Intestinicryptomonas porci]|uniref:Uncharacterized protein n=1 Tax=Intestinicryptomonas porci TaxID=2926320 RepID=A0ABU4WF65_9BACT|nr:hypothetical protein [Opitutales bacterium CLA-KB-P66]